MRLLLLLLSIFLLASATGCLGFFSGYGEKAQEYTSADYTIGQYKDFLVLYNKICATGSMTKQHERSLTEFKGMKGDPRAWSRSENELYQNLRYKLDGSVNQYNSFVGKYNKKSEDKTQDWLKIASLPNHILDYSNETVLTNSDVIDDEVLTGLFRR